MLHRCVWIRMVHVSLLLALTGCVTRAASLEPQSAVTLADRSTLYYRERIGDRLFEEVPWIQRPQALEISRVFPTGWRAAAYANFRCEGFTAGGKLKGCRIDRSAVIGDPEIEPASLNLLRSFRVSPAYAAEKKPLLSWIGVRLQFRPRGSSDSGRCIENLWCVPTAAPLPPPRPTK